MYPARATVERKKSKRAIALKTLFPMQARVSRPQQPSDSHQTLTAAAPVAQTLASTSWETVLPSDACAADPASFATHAVPAVANPMRKQKIMSVLREDAGQNAVSSASGTSRAESTTGK